MPCALPSHFCRMVNTYQNAALRTISTNSPATASSPTVCLSGVRKINSATDGYPGSRPDCVTGTLVWAHGKYDLLNNGSIVLTPLGDGYQQVQSACEDGTNIIQVSPDVVSYENNPVLSVTQDYNFTELFQSWRIFMDPTDGPKLHLFEFDGTPVAPLFQTSTTPNMLPTEKP